MKPLAKSLVVIAIATNVALVCFIIIRHQKLEHDSAESLLKAAAPALHEKISREVITLERESIAESLDKLTDVNLYYWPGPSASKANSGGIIVEYLPLDKEAGLTDMEAINSNRRFCKCFEQFSTAKRATVSDMINMDLARTIADYVKMYDAEMERFAPYYKLDKLEGQSTITGPTFITGNVQDGKIVIAGVRLKILALVWICGAMELTDCKTNIENVARIAAKQRMDLYAETTLHPFFRSEMLKRASLYNCQIIGSGLLGVIANSEMSTSVLKELGLQWQERKLSSYKAALSEFDLPVQSGVMKPDYSLGSLTIKFISPLDDAQFDQLMKKCGVAL